jgi:hypothetical protein
MKSESSTPRPEPSTPPSQAFHVIDCLSGVGRLKASKTAVPLDITIEQVERFRKKFGVAL